MTSVTNFDLRLTRHPPPHETESLVEYAINLSEVNGFETPWHLLDRAHTSPDLNAGLDVSKLAKIAGWKSELARIRYRSLRASKHWARLLGHKVLGQDLFFRYDRICTECIREKGFVEAHFDLSVMVACPIHNKMLVERCPKCEERLSFYRPGLLVCRCGESLDNVRGEEAEDCVCDLLDVVRRKTLGLPIDRKYPSGIPAGDLAQMSLRSISALIGILGRHALIERSRSLKYDYTQYVTTAAEVLSNWPRSLQKRLEQLAPNSSAANPLYLQNSGITKLQGALRRAKANFALAVISDYALDHFGPGSRIQRATGPKGEIKSRYINKRQFAKIYEVDTRSVDRLIEDHGIPAVRIKRGKRDRVLIDTAVLGLSSKLVPTKKWPSKKLRFGARDTAAMIGIPKSVVLRLKKDGIFEVRSLPLDSPGFHIRDIEQFVQRLHALTAGRSLSQAELTRFDLVMKTSTVPLEAKVTLMKGVVSGDVPLFASECGKTEGLLFPKAIVDRQSKQQRKRMIALKLTGKGKRLATGDVLDVREAAEVIGCSDHTVLMLAKEGTLVGVPTGKSYCFAREEVDKFRRKWKSVTALARSEHFSAYGLMCLCSRMKITMITIPWKTRGENQAFVLAKDVDRLLAKASELLGMKNRGKRKRLKRIGEY